MRSVFQSDAKELPARCINMITKDTYLKAAETLGFLDLCWQPGFAGNVYIYKQTENEQGQCVIIVYCNNKKWQI